MKGHYPPSTPISNTNSLYGKLQTVTIFVRFIWYIIYSASQTIISIHFYYSFFSKIKTHILNVYLYEYLLTKVYSYLNLKKNKQKLIIFKDIILNVW